MKLSFESIRKQIHQFETIAGIFLFRNKKSSKLTTKEKLLTFTLPLFFGIFAFLIVTTLIVTQFRLVNVIICCAAIVDVVTLQVGILCITFNKGPLIDILKWCESLYDVEQKFSQRIQKEAKTQMMALETRTVKILKWLRILTYLDAVCCSLGFAMVELCLPERILPKYSLPLPYYLPFREQKSWIAFVTTIAVQTKLLVDCATLTIYVFGIFFCIALHILAFLNIIKDIIGSCIGRSFI